MNSLKDTMDMLSKDKERDTKTTVHVLCKIVSGRTDLRSAVVQAGERTLCDFKRRTEQSINRQELIEEKCNFWANSCLSVDSFLQALDQTDKPLIEK